MNIPAFYVQRQIARVESTGSSVVDGNVVYTFRSHPFINAPYNGIVIIYLGDLPTSATGTEPVVFNSGDGNKTVNTKGGVLTAANLSGAGIYLFYYDNRTGSIQLI